MTPAGILLVEDLRKMITPAFLSFLRYPLSIPQRAVSQGLGNPGTDPGER
jgi:hypothetical protein